MSAVLQAYQPNEKPIKTITKVFDGFPVVVARKEDGTSWIYWESIHTVCGGVLAKATSLYYHAETLYAEIDGVARRASFVSRSDFLDAALINEKLPEFRRYVVEILEQLEDGRSVVPPDVADDPDIKMLQALIAAKATSIRAERLAHETAGRQDRLEREQVKLAGSVANATRKADVALDAISNGEFLFAVPWLEARGVHIPDNEKGRVGAECVMIAREIGDDPYGRPKRPHRGYDTHTYPPLVMEDVGRIWMDRNRRKDYRKSWFRHAR